MEYFPNSKGFNSDIRFFPKYYFTDRKKDYSDAVHGLLGCLTWITLITRMAIIKETDREDPSHTENHPCNL